ncbi:hypothetical protein HJB77_28970 [Rhizobium lentis]|uniref:hypothetical protein n=1 Tax=Rhizobium lentis TaxID=1138194 RepID=UPI001C840691|nr:hypothetical protein [Rhizobium lentis]MBX5180239.1 hypothetical protein [Rhizobium lentis]
MASIPTAAVLMSTIVRLEQSYRRDDNATALFAIYEKLCEPFEDLTEERDILLSKAAALMVIKYWVEQAA